MGIFQPKSLDRDQTHQKNRTNSLGGVSHVDGAIKAYHLRHVG